jgi:hypothetical protein
MTLNFRAAMFRDKERVAQQIPGNVLFVDPGLGGTGWANFPYITTKSSATTVVKPNGTGVIHIPASKYKEGWIQHAELISASFFGVLTAYAPRLVIIEQPALWAGSAVSHASATAGKDGEPGDLFKLAYLVGMFGGMVKQTVGTSPILIMPHEWKGQLPKEVVLARLQVFGIQAKDHEGDAIGMGIAAQGLL